MVSQPQPGFFFCMLIVSLLTGSQALAHVPYFEARDLTEKVPFVVRDITQSKAIYAYLESAEDQDSYLLLVTEAVRIYAKTIIPYCSQYADFRPSFALIGPDLPTATEDLPVEIPEGYGAIIRHDPPRGASRPSMYEYFSDQFYFEAPVLDINVTEPGDYRLIWWDPAGQVGDYVAIIGRRENFSAEDMSRSMTNTRELRKRSYLHGSCTEP